MADQTENTQKASQDSQGPIDSDITPEAFERRKPVYDPTGKIEQINHDEVRVADIRQHPFGLFVIYLQISVALFLALGILLILGRELLRSLGMNANGADGLISFFALLVIALGLVFMILAARIYNSHQLIITDQNITQVLQIGLFNRKVSELSMSNVEDVTAQQKGIFPTIFNYGTLKIETAGEQNNFLFNYCPNPNAYAKALLDARSQYIHSHGTKEKHDNV